MVGILRSIALGLALMAASLASVSAGELPAPFGDVVLTVGGKIANGNGDGRARFDMATLEALDATKIITATPWTDGDQAFVGVDLDKLMQTVGAKGDTLIVTALNDYQISVPIADFAAFHPILAYQRNGAPMPVSDKGPLFIVYPYDSDPQLQNDVFYTRSAWQVVTMVVE
jgi:hypothetical protein